MSCSTSRRKGTESTGTFKTVTTFNIFLTNPLSIRNGNKLINEAISLSQPPSKSQSTEITQISSTASWLSKLPTVQPQLRLKEFYFQEESSSCLMFFVMLVVSLSVTLNGWRTWIMSDGEDFLEKYFFFYFSGNKNQRTTSCQSLRRQPTLIQKKSTTLQRSCCQVLQKETSFTQDWKKSCRVPPKKSSKSQSRKT